MDNAKQETLRLIDQLARVRPDLGPSELLRMGLLLSLKFPHWQTVESDRDLERLCHEIAMQLTQTGDQHAAVADEIDSLAAASPCDFSPSHLWTLVRAIKVQSQILNLYLGPQQPAS